MVNCSHCGIEINRNVFCKPSHKVMFWFNKKPAEKVSSKEEVAKEYGICQANNPFRNFKCKERAVGVYYVDEFETNMELCEKHGNELV